MKSFFKILLIFFVLQSTWAVAAQYCKHEEAPKVEHFGHHTHKHNIQSDESSVHKSGENTKSGFDSDCSFCNLSSIKSMFHSFPILDVQLSSSIKIDIYYSYPEVVPLKPERPNWSFAV